VPLLTADDPRRALIVAAAIMASSPSESSLLAGAVDPTLSASLSWFISSGRKKEVKEKRRSWKTRKDAALAAN
jgi:hypothetical protein